MSDNRPNTGGVYPSGVPAPSRLYAEDDYEAQDRLDGTHVSAVLALGGYPTATPDKGWVGPNGLAWRAPPKPARRRARR